MNEVVVAGLLITPVVEYTKLALVLFVPER